MPMFRFWGNDRGSEPHIADYTSPVDLTAELTPTVTSSSPLAAGLQPPKRRRESCGDDDLTLTAAEGCKRPRLAHGSEVDSNDASDSSTPEPLPGQDRMDCARDEIRHQFGLEILLKHNELRLINQELAKCQAALEQLRRCHLIPYPVNCPTPDQMLAISTGKGPAISSASHSPLPQWAAPFGVTDGPYSRHYAKWLIPDPSFDGPSAGWKPAGTVASRSRNSLAEERSTRNSFVDAGLPPKGRLGRASTSHKLQALSNGYPQPKDKAGPCVLKRADGQTVKLVCLDCHRENFSSTQGFINHCRIAHKREFKSHEEAAVQSGQPIDAADQPAAAPAEEKVSAPAPPPAPMSSAVHPFSRPDMTDHQAFMSLRCRINTALELYHLNKPLAKESKLETTTKTQDDKALDKTEKVSSVPYLSSFMKSRNFKGSLGDLVADAQTHISFEDITPDEEADDFDAPLSGADEVSHAAPGRSSGVMRMPAGSTKPSASVSLEACPSSKKGHNTHMHAMPPLTSTANYSRKSTHGHMSDEDIDTETEQLSPNTVISNNAPSLVSDDGEYDDSDDGSSVSDASDGLDADSVSDVAEITLDDDHDARSLRRGPNVVSNAVKLRKDDSKHVTFVNPVNKGAQGQRIRRV